MIHYGKIGGLIRMQMIKFFREIGRKDIAIAGGKGCNLGELYNNKYNVPNGFVVTTKSYNDFIEIKELKQDLLDELKGLDPGDTKILEDVSKKLQKLIMDEEIYEELISEIGISLKKLKGDKFAVRSSATAEDLITASFAGQQDTYLNVKRKDVLKNVKKCWASLFTPRAIYYRHEKKIGHDVGMAVVVQEMVPAQYAGVMFTVDPIRKKFVLVEVASGLGEKVVSGSVTPSSYFLDRKTFAITEKNIEYEVNESIIKEIAKIGMQIEKHYKKPQDIEFATIGKKIFILQSRAITTL